MAEDGHPVSAESRHTDPAREAASGEGGHAGSAGEEALGEGGYVGSAGEEASGEGGHVGSAGGEASGEGGHADSAGDAVSAAVRCMRAASGWAIAWAAAALLAVVLTLADILGVPPTRLGSAPGVLGYVWSIPQCRAYVLVLVAAVAVALLARRVPGRARVLTGRYPASTRSRRGGEAGRSPVGRGPEASGTMPAGTRGMLAWWAPRRKTRGAASGAARTAGPTTGPTTGRWVGRRGRAGVVALGVAVFALVPPVYTGHSASSVDHDAAVSAVIVHAVAVSLWVGGLAAILLYLRGRPGRPVGDLPVIVTRFSALALACFAAAAVSGLVEAWTRLESVSLLWTSRYGLLLTAKVVALVALGLFGWLHRRRTIAALVTSRVARPFLRLATGEVVVMAATVGLAVALSRSAPPPGGAEQTWIGLRLGYDVPAPTLSRLLAEWRPDTLVLTLLGCAAVAYPLGVRALRRQGRTWPGERTLVWFGGLAVLTAVLLGGVGSYARAMFSAAEAQLLVVSVLAPVLLAYAAPATLAARNGWGGGVAAGGSSRMARPEVVFACYAAPFAVYYLTGWYTVAQWSQAAHLLTVAVFLGTAFLYFRVALAADPLPVRVSAQARARLLLAGLSVHVLRAAALANGPLAGAGWYRELGLMWGAPDGGGGGGLPAESAALAADQRAGAVIGGLGAVVVFLGLLLLLTARTAGTRRRPAAKPMQIAPSPEHGPAGSPSGPPSSDLPLDA
jgi:putative copper resistance protein D